MHLLKLRSDGSRLSDPRDIIAAMEKSVAFFAATAAAAAAAVLVLQWFDAPSNMFSICAFFIHLISQLATLYNRKAMTFSKNEKSYRR